MNVLSKKDPILLFIGDIVVFAISLWLTLVVRYGELPTQDLFVDHLIPFGILWLVWFIVFYIAGLYEKHTIILRTRLPADIFRAQITNTLIAVSFFYFIPFFGITPKTNLFIYLALSFVGIVLWRLYGYKLIGGSHHKQNAILISSGEEMRELRDRINSTEGYNLHFISSIDLENVSTIDFNEEILKRIYSEDVSIIVIDFLNEKVEPVLPQLYNLLFSRVVFIDMHKIYEDIFGRVPLSLLKYSWFLENISLAPKFTYDVLKRAMDICIAIPLGIISLIFYPFVWLAIKIEDGGSLFVVQERVGKNNRLVTIYKFRSMTADDGGNYGEAGVTSLKVTKVGKFLRVSRIDELPQLYNVLKGDISLIGPRFELPALVKIYEKQIPYYNIRHLIKPGLSGWAQIYHENHPHHGEAVMQTKEKLSYDLYYIKNRSLLLDLKIALKTLKALLSRTGI
jgi:lipopolysaccharide/colanic/teichoic acid biosynthesis glycosyltransferase